MLNNHYEGLVKLLEYECAIEAVDEMKHKSCVPLSLAVKNRNVPMINVFRKYGYTLEQPHSAYCSCLKCQSNDYEHVKNQVIRLKALSNPVWLSLTADDPFLVCFQLAALNRELRHCTVSFGETYDSILEVSWLWGHKQTQ